MIIRKLHIIVLDYRKCLEWSKDHRDAGQRSEKREAAQHAAKDVGSCRPAWTTLNTEHSHPYLKALHKNPRWSTAPKRSGERWAPPRPELHGKLRSRWSSVWSCDKEI